MVDQKTKDSLQRGALVGALAAVVGLVSDKGFRKRTTTGGGLSGALMSFVLIGGASMAVIKIKFKLNKLKFSEQMFQKI